MVNKAELRKFVTQYFSDPELDELCFDDYPDLLNQFTTGMTKSQKVIALISYCDHRGLSDHLLATLGELRPAAYQEWFGLPSVKTTEMFAPTESKPDPSSKSAVTKPAAGRVRYWAMGAVVLLGVMFLSWRLAASKSGESGTPPGGVISVTPPEAPSVAPAEVVTNPTQTPTLRPTVTPTLRPTVTPTLQPTVTPTQPLAQAGDIRTASRGSGEVEQVFVPAGSFPMGSEEGDADERPAHEVTLDAFWIDRTEVTNAQFAGCVAAGACRPPSDTSSYTRTDYYGNDAFADYPVLYVSWNDASDFCAWAGGRLLTEAEWEYAARGPESRVYPWGTDAPSCELLNFSGCVGDTSEVGSYPDGASWIGALDMAGNVWEWVNDWYDSGYYGQSSDANPSGPPSGEYRVLRGSAWFNYVVNVARSSNRLSLQPVNRNFSVGFRCAQE